jgi:DNA polymerase III alpha subunit
MSLTNPRRVAHIITFGTMAAKAIRDVAGAETAVTGSHQAGSLSRTAGMTLAAALTGPELLKESKSSRGPT